MTSDEAFLCRPPGWRLRFAGWTALRALLLILTLAADQVEAQAGGGLRGLVRATGYDEQFELGPGFARELETAFAPLLPPDVLERLPGAAFELDGNRLLGLFLNHLAGRLDEAVIEEAAEVTQDPLFQRLVDTNRRIVFGRRSGERGPELLDKMRDERPEGVLVAERLLEASGLHAINLALTEAVVPLLISFMVAALPDDAPQPSADDLRDVFAETMREWRPVARERLMREWVFILERFDDPEMQRLLAIVERKGFGDMQRAFSVALTAAAVEATHRFAKVLFGPSRGRKI